MNIEKTPLQEWMNTQLPAHFISAHLPNFEFLQTIAPRPHLLLTLLVCGVILYIVAISCRSAIYFMARLRGGTTYAVCCSELENRCLFVAFVCGILCGEWLFHNILFALLTGCAVCTACAGAVIEATMVNDQIRQNGRSYPSHS